MKARLDRLLVERGLADSREKAQALIMAGEVLVDGRKSAKPGHPVADGTRIEVLSQPQFVSRGGLKLAARYGAFRHSRRGSRLPGCRRFHRRLHGLPAAARRRARACRGRRHGPARLEDSQRSARGGAREAERALSAPGGFGRAHRSGGLRRQLHFGDADRAGNLPGVTSRPAKWLYWSSRSSRSARDRWARAESCAIRHCTRPPAAAWRSVCRSWDSRPALIESPIPGAEGNRKFFCMGRVKRSVTGQETCPTCPLSKP